MTNTNTRSSEYWALWELMGSTDGRTRGSMTRLMSDLPTRGWEMSLKLSTVGSDGHWPHVMGLWRVPDENALADALELGWEDGVNEDGFIWGKSKLYRKLRGGLRPDDTAYLIEYLVADRPESLAGLVAPDMVLAESLAPWQGVAIWGAADLFALTEREWKGIGSASEPGMQQVSGWWSVVTPERDIV